LLSFFIYKSNEKIYFNNPFLFFFSTVYSQNQNNAWVFGDSCGIDFTNTQNPTPIITNMVGRGSCVSICDTNGILMLYAYTVESSGALSTIVRNGLHQKLNQNNTITGVAWYNELALFPKPGTQQNLYYLFSVGLNGAPNPGLYHTTIDMNLNNGLGGIVQQNIQIDNIEYGDCLTCVRHGNGRDWWVMAKINNFPFTFYNRFRTRLVTADSIYPAMIQDFNDASDGSFEKICWHPSYNKFMMIDVRGYMSEFDFDRCTGIITQVRTIFAEQLSNFSNLFWEGAYSPNGNVFYVSRTSYGGNFGDYNYLLQYDLTAIDIPASCDTLDSTIYPQADCGAVRLAPDGKIYYSQAYPWGFPYQDSMHNVVNENLGVVNFPDSVGKACNFLPFSFYLGGKRTYYGLPNNPDYSLGPLQGSPCDTLQWVGTPETPNLLQGGFRSLRINPNPANNSFYIKYDIPTNENLLFVLYDSYGKEVLHKNLYGTFKNLLVHTEQLNNGIYFWRAVKDYNTKTQRSNGKSPEGDLGVGAQNGKIVILH